MEQRRKSGDVILEPQSREEVRVDVWVNTTSDRCFFDRQSTLFLLPGHNRPTCCCHQSLTGAPSQFEFVRFAEHIPWWGDMYGLFCYTSSKYSRSWCRGGGGSRRKHKEKKNEFIHPFSLNRAFILPGDSVPGGRKNCGAVAQPGL